MSKAHCDIRIGTSGWHYNHWTKVFYPAALPKSKWFEHYAGHFDTVEINNTFYHLPKQQTFELWHRKAPENFIYTVKANRYITHIKRLTEPAEPLERFFAGANLLKEKLGPVLYQLPPSFHKDLDRLTTFLEALPKERLAIFEFRHKSWFAEDTYELLEKFKAGFCVHDMPGMKVPRVVTGGVIYLRFHGTTGRYSGNYTKAALKKWAEWVKENIQNVCGVYAYFNNDFRGYAVFNAQQLREFLLK